VTSNDDEPRLRATIDVMHKLYVEHSTTARHHETLRDRSTTLIVTIAVALSAFLSTRFADPGGATFSILALFVVALGFFGALVSYKHFERNRLHTTYARAFRDEMAKAAKQLIGVDPTQIIAAKRETHHATFRSHRLRAHVLWVGICLTVSLIGFLMAMSRFLFGPMAK
jgi:hypothetical protein